MTKRLQSKPKNNGNRLIGMTVVRNESKRYLRQWLGNMSHFVDFHVFVDDGSDDDTPDCIDAAIKEGYPGVIARNTESIFLINEPKLRGQSWDLLRRYAHTGDWVFVVDADEFFDERLLSLKKRLFRLPDRKTWVGLTVLDMWNLKQYRIDRGWSDRHASPRIFRFCDMPWGIKPPLLHQYPVPNGYGLKRKNRFTIYIPLIHLGYFPAAYRRQKAQFYQRNIDQSKYPGNFEFVQSILNDTPQLASYPDRKLRMLRWLNCVLGRVKIDPLKDIDPN